MHCNQNRKDKPRWNDDITGETQGKMDQFPIDDEADRAFTPDDDLSTEHTYLIDPCSENPEDYLGFDATGQIFATGDNIYGDETIRVFHLDRRRLRDLRSEKVYLTLETIRAMNRATERGDAEAVQDFRRLLDLIQSDTQQFAAVARYVERDPSAFDL